MAVWSGRGERALALVALAGVALAGVAAAQQPATKPAPAIAPSASAAASAGPPPPPAQRLERAAIARVAQALAHDLGPVAGRSLVAAGPLVTDAQAPRA